MIRIGSGVLSKIAVGTEKVSKILLGDDLIWQASLAPSDLGQIHTIVESSNNMQYYDVTNTSYKLRWNGSSAIGASAWWVADFTDIAQIKMDFTTGTCYASDRFPCYIGIAQDQSTWNPNTNPIYISEVHGGAKNSSFSLTFDASGFTGVQTFAAMTPGWNLTMSGMTIT